MGTVIYARKSTESEDRQIQSLQDQLTALRSLATREGISVAEEIVEAKSAKEPGVRPEFGRLIRGIEEGRITGLLTWHVNRLSRNMVDGGLISHYLQTGRIKFIQTPDRVYRPEDSALLLAIEHGVATNFIQDLSRNVKRGMAGKAARGTFPGKAPLGYLNDTATKMIKEDPARFELLRHGWQLLIKGGLNVADVHRELTRMGLRSNSGKVVSPSTIYKLFSSRFYVGEFLYAGTWHEGTHEPMVTKDDFALVQRRISRPTGQRDPEQKHPYAGVFTCAVCGCQITAETKTKTYQGTGRKVSYTYYRCSGYRGCTKAAVRSEQLDAALIALINRFVLPDSIAKWGEAELSARQSAVNATVPLAAQQVGTQRTRIEKKLVRLRELRLDGEISAEEFKTDKEVFEKELAQLRADEAKLISVRDSDAAVMTERLRAVEQASSWETMGNTAKRHLVRSLTQKCFLTLEKAQFIVDPVIAKIAGFEPPVDGSGSMKLGDLVVCNFDWQGQIHAIRTPLLQAEGGGMEVAVCLEFWF